MKVVPMIFNTDMVKALMAGDKVVTRRPAKLSSRSIEQGVAFNNICQVFRSKEPYLYTVVLDDDFDYNATFSVPCRTGDLIYVRETFAALGHNDYQQISPRNIFDVHEFRYKASERDSIANCADWEVRGYHWCPSIHMPRIASRLTLKVTDVRIERVQDITEEQAIKEGMPTNEECQRIAIESGLGWYQKPVIWFKSLWDSIYGNWHQNPYVWVIEFEVIHQNVDQYLQSIKNAA
ncbi:hypothetical protein ATY35_09545 [Vibrio cidicii]|uniref:Morphogenetic protein n=1 Tax=Vibrio cidicii TaxID=1763883 RepID=A0ABR5W5M0_9VIBR|nr:hypothetical protein [Vibrio cidicii]KYN90527.1 hypothetical protein ATY35_09545 [Vibrio cidicii]